MLQLYNLDKVKIRGLKLYKDYSIESVLSSGDKTLSFLYPQRLCKEVIEETYIRTKKDEFVVKSVSGSGEWKTIVATLNVEDLEGKVFESFDTSNKTITESLNLALAGTGWTIGTCDVTRRRTVRKTNSSSWEIIQEAKKIYRAELEFDTLNKRINIFDKRGSDKGVYFIDTLNLRDLDIQSNSYDFYTKILAIGKDDIRVNLENFQYSKKVKTFIWKDDRYTDINSLTEDAAAKLEELSKPYRSYAADVIDLANTNEKYKILSYGLGDTITIVSKDRGVKEKQRIVKMKEYLEEPYRNTCEIANITLKFEDIQKEFQDTSDTVSNITTDDGTIDGNSIDGISTSKIYDFEANVVRVTDLTVVNARIENLYSEKANFGDFNAVRGRVGDLEVTKLTATVFYTEVARINNAFINKADIVDLNVINQKVTVIEGDTANFKTLLNGNLTSGNIQAGGITSASLTIANGFINNAMIANLDVAKINAGDISTTKFRITSSSGNMLIADNTIQIRDTTRVRVQIGKDASNDYNMYVWDSTGRLMFDATGLKADGIKNKIIRDDMVSDTANISGAKLNIASVVTSINGGVTTINSSKVLLDGTAQTLNVAFNSLKTEVQSIEVGGRNYIRNGNASNGTSYFVFLDGVVDYMGRQCFYQTVNTTSESFIMTARYNHKLAGEKVTISFLGAKTPNVSTSEVFLLIKKIGSVKDWDYAPNTSINMNENLMKYTWTLTMPVDAESFYIRFDNNGSNNVQNATIYITDVQLEKGTKAGDYLVAQEDTDKSISDIKEITTSQSTTISVMQGEITTAINNSQIVKDGQTILLKDDYNRTVQTVNSSSETIGRHESTINANTGSITNVTTEITEVKRDLTGITQRVGSSETNITTVTTTANKGVEDARLAKLQADKGVADALLASNKATTAQNTANTASTNANTANTKLGDIASDSKLTESEKKIAKKEWDIIVSEKAKIEAEGTKFGISITDYTTKYNTLNTYITPLLVDLNSTSDIVGATFRLNFANYYNARQDLLNAITSKAKSLADTAQAQANLGVTNASTAQTQANLGVANANTAQVQANKGVADALTAFNKAGQVLIDAKAYTNAEITTVTNKVTSANSEITQLKNQIALKVEATDITTAITNINIGGRNLLRNSPNYANKLTYVATSNDGYTHWTNIKADLLVGVTYTISYKTDGVKSTTHTTGFDKVGIWVVGTTSLFLGGGGSFTVPTSGSWFIRTNIYLAGRTHSFWDIQVEEGNKATDWTPAPEDVDKSIADTITLNTTNINQAKADITIETNSIKQSVSSVDSRVTTVTTTANNALTNASTAQTQANKGVADALNAQNKANTVSQAVTDMSNDNVLTPVEKVQLKKEWAVMVAEKPSYNSLATTYAITTENTNYNTTYDNLNTALNNTTNGYFLNMATNSVIVGTTFRALFDDYYDKKALLNKKVNELAKARADLGVANASTAQTKANTVESTVATTNTKVATLETNLTNITSRVSATEGTTTTINGTITSLSTRVTTAEQKITATAIVNTINESINNGTTSINTVSTTLDNTGFTVKNGAIKILNKVGSTVLTGDVNGNLVLSGLIKIGNSYFSATEATFTDYLTMKSTYNDNATMFYSREGYFYPKGDYYCWLGAINNAWDKVFSGEVRSPRKDLTLISVTGNTILQSAYTGANVFLDINGYWRPSTNNGIASGHPNSRWSTVYATGVNQSSDRNSKENINYIPTTLDNDSNISFYGLSNETNNDDAVVTLEDLYGFVKDDFKLATYNYKKDNAINSVGFIAQDIVNAKIKNILIQENFDEDNNINLSYDMANYISILAGALKVATQKLEKLENEIQLLKDRAV